MTDVSRETFGTRLDANARALAPKYGHEVRFFVALRKGDTALVPYGPQDERWVLLGVEPPNKE